MPARTDHTEATTAAPTAAPTGARPVALAYGSTLLAFCLLDFGWLSLMAPRFYQAQVGQLLLEAPQWQPGLAFYLLYTIGLAAFCVLPAWRTPGGGWMRAAAAGALFGLVAYATYDLSNLATLKGWTGALTVVDMAWGAVASAIACTCGYLVTGRFAPRRR